ncbi:MAG: polymer-forming cytoskeletal protein [Alphaproteobacteria bacterium]|jgi:cytoskeletal protein CcmA (bactofilin family)|nr:polymer-forming cytoskeletal protein [Alphaproteobacteria bacterium]MDP6624410.1 polymer-forming cytoskeletal protein [Alphaproteobacteria bacterium]
MFSKTDKSKGRQQSDGATDAKTAPSIISANLHIVGTLKTEGEIQVDGTIEGDVSSQSLTVGEKAKVMGEIVAEEANIHGEVSGKIRARVLQLARTATVVGDIWHEVLAIESGAYIEAQLRRSDRPLESGEKKLGRVPEPKGPAPKPKIAESGDPEKAETTTETSAGTPTEQPARRAAGS